MTNPKANPPAYTRHGRALSAALAGRSRRELRYIHSVMHDASVYASARVSIPQEVEWLLDNWYIAEREGRAACSDISSFRSLPGTTAGRGAAFVSLAARACLEDCGNEVTAERLEHFLNEFQDDECLVEDELAAFIPALKLALISALASACRELSSVLSGGERAGLSDCFGSIFTSLRFLSGFDATPLLGRVNRVERELRRDPAGVYAQMDEQTRGAYRRELRRVARRKGLSEHKAACHIVELCGADGGGHVGRYIFTEPLGARRKPPGGGVYIGFILLVSLFFTLLTAYWLGSPVISALLLLPVSEIVKSLTDFAALRILRIRRVPRLELPHGIPDEGRTLCAVSLLLSSEKSGARAAALLEEYRLLNRDAGDNLLLCLLCDLPEAKTETLPVDETVISGAAREIGRLNEKYGGGFLLLCRGRTYNAADGIYGGWERKRGAILELCRTLRGKTSGVYCPAGDLSSLASVKYLITLDSDTRLGASSARELVGAIMHPLNRAVIDKNSRSVVRGSGIIQPRVSVSLASAGSTDFTLIFAGQGGIDPYGGAASDLYQNMLGTGSFTGKGIIDIDAYLTCLDGRFPENRVLSHDLLEGAILRCAFAGDIELTDSYPTNVKSYYGRMHRWTRGDWQTIPWLLNHAPDVSGKLTANPLCQADKWKIVDNLRRSLAAPAAFIALFLGMLTHSRTYITVFAIAAAAIFIDLLITGVQGILRPHFGRARYVSVVLGGFGGGLVRTLVRLILLPFEAWVCLSAIVTALFRMCFTRRKMLEWTTAADAEKRGGSGIFAYYVRMWICPLAALAIFLLTPHPSAAAAAIIWALAPAYAVSLGRSIRSRREVSAQSRLFLSRCAGDIWRYFEDFITPDDNYLPPDNFQEQPAAGLAHRTSPTNIGLYLLAALAAVDMGACKWETARDMISKTLKTVTALPKWNGHLYNWYDTVTLCILPPAYVSTVDSGNFAASLIALREGLCEHGETELAATVTSLIDGMSFKPLFDSERQLFCIGIDAETGKPSESWYDLFSSEARLTSYLATARGDAPRRHWRRLGRALVSQDGYRGMVSWTGTMFEYLMPELLLPCYRDSLIYESLKFCVYTQRRHAGPRPWGASESAYYAFDHTLSYRYKAHGVSRLALKRGMDKDLVVAPYASFLALTVDLKAAINNLRRIQRLGAEGRYGFYEALDYTPSRVRNGSFEPVRTYMAHHIGMSIIAIDNVLNGGIMQRRFMKNREMSAFSELLTERVPLGGAVLRRAPKDAPDRPVRAASPAWSLECGKTDVTRPRCCLLSNGAYTVMMAETGHSRSIWNGLSLTRYSREASGQDAGVSFFIKCGDELMPLQPAPFFSADTAYSVHMSGGACIIGARGGGFETAVTVTVPKGDNGELRAVEISSGAERDIELVCYFEPVLSRYSDYESHPAFSKLSLETSMRDNMIVIKRRPRGKGRAPAIAFTCDRAFTFDTSRELSLGRGGILSLSSALSRTASGSLGAVLDPCVLARVPLHVTPDAPVRVSFVLAPSPDEDSAIDAAMRILEDGGRDAAERMGMLARALSLAPGQIDAAMDLLGETLFHSPVRRIQPELIPALSKGQAGMWTLGVSGDFPILASHVDSAENLGAAEELIRIHALLSGLGAALDLVFLITDGGDYRSAQREGLMGILRGLELSHTLGARGGVHIADSSSDGADTASAAAVRVLNAGQSLLPGARDETAAFEPVMLYASISGKAPEYGYDEDNSFTFTSNGKLPPNAWSHVLTGGDFGYLATDSGTGHMWYQNARENKINRWENDSLATCGTERLMLLRGDERISLFAAPDGYPCRVTYGFGFARWEKSIGGITTDVTAFTPPGESCRVMIIKTSGASDCDILYYTDITLGADASEAVYVTTELTGGAISARNVYSADFEDTVYLHMSSRPESAFTCSKHDYLTGRMSGAIGTGFVPCVAARYPATDTLVLVTGCGGFAQLSSLCSPDAAGRSLGKTVAHWRGITSRLTVSTPSEDLNHYLNGWAIYQTYACRILARTSLYQSGGAYGFRDQLQDVCALAAAVPDETRAQLLRAAAHQFEEGDVQHWWHPGTAGGRLSDKGVRTKCSDDLLWLPYTLCVYVETTGDNTICSLPAPYLKSAPLQEDEAERYEQPEISQITEPLFKHAARAIDLVLSRGTGRHGLCLIGSGDWNDGMNLVGISGEGESVWLTWFMSYTARRFADLCDNMSSPGMAARYREAAETLSRAAEDAWDGNWYLRGYFDDGSPLGGAECDECRIDSIAQSFAALAGADPERVRTALLSSVDILFNRDRRVIMLFDPPFSRGLSSPGYIRGYSPGFRENGGQYTHGAIWLSMALLMSGMTELGWETISALLPQGRPMDVYRTEPYVLAADVYSNERHVGRGGWTWYTGASGWYYRVATENLLGLTVRGGVLHVSPRLPQDWDGFEAIWRRDGAKYMIRVLRGGTVEVTRDGAPAQDGAVQIADDNAVTGHIT